MEVKRGYKQTEVGAIPEDWGISRFSEFMALQNGVNADKSAYGSGLRFINVLEVITKSHLHAQDIPGRVKLSKSRAAAYVVRHGDVVFNRTSETQEEVGLSAVYVGDEPVLFGGFVIRGRPKNDTLHAIYAGYGLRAPLIRAQIVARGQGAIRANIGQADLKTVWVPLPAKNEQRAIAEALNDADTLIESLEKLLTKKRHLKQGAMQQLLAGKKRLPGFEIKPGYKQTEVGLIPEDWEIMPFLRAVKSYIDYRGRTPRKLGMSWGGGDILALSANNVQMGGIDSDKEAYFGSDKLYRKWMVQGECERGDILLTMEAPLGNVAQIPDSKKYILSQRVLLIKPKDWLERNFLSHYMKGSCFQRQLSLNSTGSTAMGIKRRKLDELPIYFPPTKTEQEAIATILSDMDAEIAALEAKLTKTRQIKQGMMQELLTGRIRLIN